MRIDAMSASPTHLLDAIDKAMNDGDLKTWKIVKGSAGQELYTHTPEQWNEKALISREVKLDRVVFEITFWNGNPAPSIEIKGYYFGRFTEILLVHFGNRFSRLEVMP
jgi:hypothetical protein